MKRGKPLERRTPLRRGKRLSPKRKRARRSHAVKDEARKAFVRTLPCHARGLGEYTGYPCLGDIEPHHASDDRGLGQKCSDEFVIPLCHGHHRQLEDLNGAFKRFNRATLRAWQDEAIKWTQWAYEAAQARGAA